MNKRASFQIFLGLLLVLAFLCLNAEAADKKPAHVKYGHNHPTDSPAHIGALAFKKIVETGTEEKLIVDIYPSMQLGSNRVQVESIQQNSIQVDWQPSAVVGTFLPEIQLLDLPFLFPSEDVMWKVLDGPYGKELFEKLRDKNIHGLGFVWTGFKQITANKPITKAEDINGLKMRVMNSPLLISQYKAWGANPVPIDFGELYNALQQKVVDGQENPAWAISDRKFYEVQSNLTKTNHAPVIAILMASKTWYDKLSNKDKQIVDRAAREAVLADRAELKKVNDKSWDTIKASGIQINELSPEERTKLKELSNAVYTQAREKFGDRLEFLENLIKATN